MLRWTYKLITGGREATVILLQKITKSTVSITARYCRPKKLSAFAAVALGYNASNF
jgi:hypothetical protein